MEPQSSPTKPIFKRDSWGRYEVWPSPHAIALGRMLRRARLMAGLSQEQLSYKSGVSQSVISRFERGLAPGMTTERLIMIGAVLDLRLPLGFCPHDHGCLWSRILPVDYEHPPAKPRTIGLPVVDKHVRRRGAEIGRRYVRAIASGALARGAETSDALRARITKEVDEERATSA